MKREEIKKQRGSLSSIYILRFTSEALFLLRRLGDQLDAATTVVIHTCHDVRATDIPHYPQLKEAMIGRSSREASIRLSGTWQPIMIDQ